MPPTFSTGESTYPPHSRGRAIASSVDYRVILAAIMMMSVMMLILTSKSPSAESGVLAFSDANDSASGAVLALALALWMSGCAVTRRSLRVRVD